MSLKKIFIMAFLGLSVLSLFGCRKSDLSENNFLLTIDYDDCVESGKEVVFHCKLTFSEKAKISHGSKLISYEINGEGETVTSQAIIETFQKGQTEERDISLTFKEKGSYTVTFFSEFEIEGNNSKEYKIQKDITINVH